jgi:hypothetical protein
MTPLIDILRRKPLPRSKAGEPIGELFAAIRGEIPHAGSHFDYACPLTELVNVGVLAIRSGKTIEWDAAAMKVKNAPEFDAWIKEPVREGWSYGEDLVEGVIVMLRCFIFLLMASSLSAKPNVVFIAIDDLANDCTHTPHIDRLAASGVRFERAYNQIPLCNPSRASVLTGRRPDATQVYDLDRHFREALPDVVTLPQLFRQNGWFTARVGKIYHYDVPKGIGTDGLDDKPSWQLVVNPKGRDVTDEKLITNPTPQKPVSAALSWLAADGTDEEQTDGMIATEAIQLLEKHRDEPFFLGVGFFRPHTPFVAPKKYFDLHPLESIRLPEAPADDRSDIPVAAFAHNNPTPHYGLDELTCRKALQAYRASVSFVDAQIGRVLDALDNSNSPTTPSSCSGATTAITSASISASGKSARSSRKVPALRSSSVLPVLLGMAVPAPASSSSWTSFPRSPISPRSRLLARLMAAVCDRF